jgi:hypothetical protein
MDKTWHKAVFFRDPLERFLPLPQHKLRVVVFAAVDPK